MVRRINVESYIGKTFEKLTVVGATNKEGSGTTYLVADCSCGAKGVLVLPYQLGKGKNLLDLQWKQGKRPSRGLTHLVMVTPKITENKKGNA